MTLSTYLIYYIEINLVCFVLNLYILSADRKKNGFRSTEELLFGWLLGLVMLYCAADTLAAAFKGSAWILSRGILYLCNSIYIAMPLILALIWDKYTFVRIYGTEYRSSTGSRILDGVMVAAILAVFSTPFTGYAFTLNAENIYSRGIGAYISPVFCWIYQMIIIIRVVRHSRQTKNRFERENLKTLLYFYIPTALATVIQLLIYGVTISQVGFTGSVLLVYLSNKSSQISRDELTGLNNRREYEKYMDNLRSGARNCLICMIDVDNFKKINDTYGHLEGDRALINVADILKKACSHIEDRLFIARFGGDEFIIASRSCADGTDRKLEQHLEAEIRRYNDSHRTPFEIGLSVGIATEKSVSGAEAVSKLVSKADEVMYTAKQQKKAGR